VSLAKLLGILRRRGQIPPARMSLADWRRWMLDRGEGEKGREGGE